MWDPPDPRHVYIGPENTWYVLQGSEWRNPFRLVEGPDADAAQDTDSYREFADGPFLTAKGLAWFWDAYLPDHEQRAESTASPLRAGLGDLAGLPQTFLLVDENDVLRDEGEAYARKLTAAGVRTTSVRSNGILHDFMMLNPFRDTAATTGAVDQAIHVLRKALRTD